MNGSRYFKSGIVFEANKGAGSGGEGSGGASGGTGEGSGKASGEGKGAGGEEDPLEKLEPAAKLALDKRIADAVAKATTEVTEKTKSETLAEIEKDRKAAERKSAREKADKDGDHAEALRLANEERDLAKAEGEKAKKDAQAVIDQATKMRIAAKHKLPDGWHDRLIGSNEAEWDADAASVAKGLPAHKGPEMEGGNRGKGTQEEQQKSANAATTQARSMF
jgi:hypothetical protein